jgi:tetratricopeptide (TPR) repeat protein
MSLRNVVLLTVSLSVASSLASLSARAAVADPPVPAAAKDDGPQARADGRDDRAAKSEEPTLTDADLERMLAPLASDDGDARRAAARSVEGLGQDAVLAITKQLAAQRKATTSSVAAAVKVARDAAGKATDTDLCEALLRTKSEGLGYRPAVVTAVLLRALAHVGTTPALRQLVKVAGDHGGLFRPEIARHVKALGEKTVPALIESRKESSEVRHWAVSQLEGMGKRIPGDAVQTKDNQVLADVLRAFAGVHDMDALPVLLSFVNSDRIQVRAAAREALGQFGQDAVWKLREAYSNVTGKAAPEGWQAPQIAKELFAAYDRLRLQEVNGLLDEGLAKEKEGKLEEAIAAFDKVLARQPMIERRGEMVSAYVSYAEKISASDSPKALALFRKATRLWPESPRVPHVEAEIAYLEGKELLARGIADVEPFKRALTLEPGHEKARAELARLETNVEERQDRIRALAAAGAVVVVGVAGIILFGGRSRRSRRTASA